MQETAEMAISGLEKLFFHCLCPLPSGIHGSKDGVSGFPSEAKDADSASTVLSMNTLLHTSRAPLHIAIMKAVLGQPQK